MRLRDGSRKVERLCRQRAIVAQRRQREKAPKRSFDIFSSMRLFAATARTGANFVSCTSLRSNEDINEITVIIGVSQRAQPNDRMCCAYTLDKKPQAL